MNMKEFYERYNLNKYDFASMAGVGTRSLIKYEKGEKIRESTRERIEKAVRVAEKYDLKRPRYDYSKGFDRFGGYRHEHRENVHEYIERFKSLLETEL